LIVRANYTCAGESGDAACAVKNANFMEYVAGLLLLLVKAGENKSDFHAGKH
jgi:hypothetical protein